MIKILKWSVAGSMALVAAVATESGADANSSALGAMAGQANMGSYQGCFDESYGGVKIGGGQYCPNLQLNITTREYGVWWQIQMPVQSTGTTYTPKTYVYGTASNPITCQAVGISDNQGTINVTTTQTAISGSTSLSFSVAVPAGGNLYTQCDFGASPAEWYSVTW